MTLRYVVVFCLVASLWTPFAVAAPAAPAGGAAALEIWTTIRGEVQAALTAVTGWLAGGSSAGADAGGSTEFSPRIEPVGSSAGAEAGAGADYYPRIEPVG